MIVVTLAKDASDVTDEPMHGVRGTQARINEKSVIGPDNTVFRGVDQAGPFGPYSANKSFGQSGNVQLTGLERRISSPAYVYQDFYVL